MIPSTTYPGKVCVYSHSVAGQIFYVGKGRAQRPFEYRYRTPRWKTIVEAAGGCYQVAIERWFETDTEASAFEVARIRELRPAGNYVHGRIMAISKPLRETSEQWGGKREGSGRPFSKQARCNCGAMTAKRAKARWHKC